MQIPGIFRNNQRMRKTLGIIFVVTLALILSVGCRPANRGTEAISLRLSVKKGDSFEETSEMELKLLIEGAKPSEEQDPQVRELLLKGGKVDVSLAEDQVVTGVRPGHIEIRSLVTKVSAKGTGALKERATELLGVLKGDVVITETDERNRLLRDTPEGEGDFLLLLPDRPVRVGETWTGAMRVLENDRKGTFQFLRRETVDGIDTAVVSATFDDGDPQIDEMITWFAIDSGMPVRSRGQFVSTVAEGVQLRIRWTSKTLRKK